MPSPETAVPPEAKIMEALRQYRDRSGAQLSEMTGLPAGTLYPALIRLEDHAVIESRWFNEDAPYPRRRVYRIKENDNDL